MLNFSEHGIVFVWHFLREDILVRVPRTEGLSYISGLLYYKIFQTQTEVCSVTSGGKDADTTKNLYFLFPWMLSFWGWLLRVALTKPTPRQNCFTSLVCALRDKGMNLAGCQLINRPLMNLCHCRRGVSTLLGTCCQQEVEN